jgi:hypothetical protein
MCLMLRDTARVASVHALPATISNPAFARPSLSGAPHSIFESSHITTADRPAAGANGLAPPVPFISRRDGCCENPEAESAASSRPTELLTLITGELVDTTR